MSTGSARSILSIEKLQSLYDRNLFLDAFHQSAAYWNPSIRLTDLSARELVFGGRLASRLGSSRLSRHLFKAAFARDPSDPYAIYYSSYIYRRGWRLFDVLRAFESNPEIPGADAEIRANRFAYHAAICGSLRDFVRAHEYLKRAHACKAHDGWVLSCESDIFGYEDRWDEALKYAELAWEVSPGTPFAARSLSSSLLNLRRVQEAADRLAEVAENGQSHEIASLACWYLCAAAETHTGEERKRILNRAENLAGNLEALAPLADRDTRLQFARTRIDIAEMSDDHEGMERWAAEARSPFHRKMLENFRANPKGQRIRLPFRRAVQKHNACLPTSLSSALAVHGVNIDPDTMSSEITFGGTHEWSAAEWLEKRGLTIRFFAVTPEIAARLIQNGIAFVITLEGDFSAHAVAAVGLDEAAGTLIIHDPQSFRSTEYLLESIGKGQTPLGPLGMAVVPPEKISLVDQILPADNTGTITLEQAYRRESFLHGSAAAGGVIAKLIDLYPAHPITHLLQSIHALAQGQTSKALVGFQELAVAYPNAAFVRSNLLASCRSLQNTAIMRGILADVVERGVLPGVQSQQEWLYPPANYVSEYADLLRSSGETQSKARSILHSVILRQPSYAPAWHILGDLLWHERDIDGALLAFRTAACLAENNEHYASAFCDALAEAGHEDEGLKWLETRVREFGTSARAVATWVTWISSLERLGHPQQALAASAEAITHHAGSPELLAFVVPFVARMGQWDEAESLLPRLERAGNSVLFNEAAVAFYKMRGDLEKSIQYAEKWVAELPLSMEARDELISLIAKRDGAHQAASLAKSWMEERAGHDRLEALYCQQLDRSQAPAGKKHSVLMRRVKRNPEDGWAWRELAFGSVYQFGAAAEKQQAKIKRRLANFISQCLRTSPGDAATLRLHAEWQQAQGEWSQAVDLWMEAIDRAPKVLYSYQHAWDCASHLDASQRQKIWERMQELFLGSAGRLYIARDLILMAAQRFGLVVAEQTASHWSTSRQDDPGAVEAYAALLLNYGHGRTDFERALEMLEPAVRRFPYYSALRFSQADALKKLGRFAEAEDVLSEIALRHPDNSSAQIQLARVQDRRGQAEEALARLDIAILRDPQNTSLFEVKIEILMRAKRFRQAVAVVREGLQRFPKIVHWREKSIRLLLECGDAEAAVQAARGGTLEYPSGAYLWLLLGRTLHDHRRFAAQGEIESVLRQSLVLNPGLFETADYLAMLLVELRRYSEAEDLMHKVVNRLDDPSPALGRLAWIHREEGKKNQALTEIAALMSDAPSYRWGWNVFMAWLEEDKSWDLVRKFLGSIPPEVRTDIRFRQKRLQLLEKSGLPIAELDSEWNALLVDFPEEVSLHLLRYDFLHERKRNAEAAAALEVVPSIQPHNPYYLARFVEVLTEAGKKEEAIKTLLSLFFAEAEPSIWPPNYSWAAVRKAHYEEEVYARARKQLEQGARPTLRATAILAGYAIERNHTKKKLPQPAWRILLPDRGAREILSFLKILGANESHARPLRGTLFRQLTDVGYNQLVVKYWKKHPVQVESDIGSWSETARALAGLKSNKRAARKFMSGWRQRAGVEMWVVANLVTCYSPFRRKQLREMVSTCHDAMAGLPHDHCARFLAYVEAESCALLGDKEAFLKTWQEYKNYFDGRLENHEWFQGTRKHLLADIPAMARSLQEGRKYKKMVWQLRRDHLFAKTGDSKFFPKRFNPRWILWGIWALWMLSRFFQP